MQKSFSKETAIFSVFLLLYIVFIIFTTTERTFFQYNTETDYLSLFVPEANQVLSGQPLELAFHPPLYSLLVALVQFVTGDWMVTGLAISVLSAAVALTCAFVFFGDICGRHAAWGAVLGLVASAVFITYSVSTTSDVFFLAIYFACSMLAAKAILTRSDRLWFLTGMLVACGLLARSNGLSLAFLVLAPWFSRAPLQQRGISCGYVVAGFLVPVAAWLVYASVTGSSFMPSGNTVNLAMTYFSPLDNRASGDALQLVRQQFGHMSLIEVLLYDPAHLIKTYVVDLRRLITWRLPELVQFPLDLFFLPGLALLIFGSFSRYLFLFLLLALGQLLLVNLKTFEPRFAMFLLPFMGAGAGILFREIVAAARGTALKIIAGAFLLLAAAAAAVSATFDADVALHSDDVELAEVLPIVQREVRSGATIVARKPHLGYYASGSFVLVPQVDTQQELTCFLSAQTAGGAVYLYYGPIEQEKRPQFRDFLLTDTPPPGLAVVAESAVPDRWVLYRYRPVGDGGPC